MMTQIAVGTNNLTTTYKYDGADRRVEKVDPEGNKASYDYDTFGRLTRKTEDDGGFAVA